MADGMKQFKIEEIAAIHEGALAMAVNKLIHQAFLDCEDRPAIKSKRTITLKMGFEPELDNAAKLYKVRVSFELGKDMPKQGLLVTMRPGEHGLEFKPECPDNPDQRTLDYQPDSDA